VLTTGFVGGRIGDQLLRTLGRHAERVDPLSGTSYRGRSKLEVLFGPSIWGEIAGKKVIDVGCGIGDDVLEMAQRGAYRVIGLDVRETVLEQARRAATDRALSDRCLFTTHTRERADVIVSIDGFEHYDNPEWMLRQMRTLIRPHGRALIAFGPPWFHPYGGHLFSVFPWAHLIFTEAALIRWRARFKSDGATRFGEVAGGLNQMTVGRFERLVASSDFEVVEFAARPIRRLRPLANRLTREVLTSSVRCTLIPKAPGRTRRARG
jgi:SAM-dependent methyltransferase